MAETFRRKRVLLSILIVTIYPPIKILRKTHCRRRSGLVQHKIVNQQPPEDKRPRLRKADGLSLESLHKNKADVQVVILNLPNP